MSSALKVSAFPRIHVGLLDMGGATLRAFGGCGFSVSAFPVGVVVTKQRPLSIQFECDVQARTIDAVTGAVKRFQEIFHQAKGELRVVRCTPEHIGLGSKTALMLAVVKAMQSANGLKLSDGELVQLSGRGGASGVGVNTFFRGGFVADSGHPQDHVLPMLPSSMRGTLHVPILNLRCDLPADWTVHLMLPRSDHKVDGEDERDFFAINTPLPRIEVLESIAAVYHGVVPGIVSGDLELLADGLSQLSKVGFKRRELIAQPSSAGLLEDISRQFGLPVGMSSMGPLIYVLTSKDSPHKDGLVRLSERSGAAYLGAFSITNNSHVITYE